jgi:hypothetical protein
MSRVAIIALALYGAATVSAPAQSPDYVGTWAEKTAQCRLGQDREDAPMVMKKSGYDEHETHCSFTSVRKRGASWAVAAKCSVDGDNQNIKMTLKRAGNRLEIGGDLTRTLQRCG